MSILSGFYYISKLFRCMSRTLDLLTLVMSQLSDMRQQTKGDMSRPTAGHFETLSEIYHGVMTLMHDCPEGLRLALQPDAKNNLNDWNDEVEQLFWQVLQPTEDPTSMAPVNAFLVQQANIYVTQQVARCQVLQYRDQLVGAGGCLSPHADLLPQRMTTDEEKITMVQDLLGVLRKIPFEVIGRSCRGNHSSQPSTRTLLSQRFATSDRHCWVCFRTTSRMWGPRQRSDKDGIGLSAPWGNC